ncbi:MAG: DNA recombination/repair protein RecA, partial [Lachnospiraceae bacterium]|nr:DNA recombination/repair protein RecA [Lachnospiraceae bacterium]
GQGISREGDVLDIASDLDIVNKSGAWYAYKGDKIGQGRENAKNFLKENPAIFAEIEEQVREHYFNVDDVENGVDNTGESDAE